MNSESASVGDTRADRDRLGVIQWAIRQTILEPTVDAKLASVVEAARALGWERAILALVADGGAVEQLCAAGLAPGEEESYRRAVLPPGTWDSLVAGALEAYRREGVYCVLAGDPAGTDWTGDDVVFAPLLVAQEQIAGILRVERPTDGRRPDRDALRALDVLAVQSGYIVENARLFAAQAQSARVMAEQLDELAMIHRADRELSSHLDIDRVMRLAMDWALRRTRADSGILFLATDEGRGLVPSVVMGRVERENFPFDAQNPLPLDHGIIGRAARESAMQRVLEVVGPGDAIPFLPQARAHISVPLAVRGQVLGVIVLASHSTPAFDEPDVSFVERLARRAAIALDNARLFRQAEQTADDMALLYTATHSITSTSDRDQILQRIAQAMTLALESSSTAICDYRPGAREVRVLATYRLGTAHDAHEELPAAGQPIALPSFPAFQMAVEQQHPLVVRAADPAIAPADRAQLMTRQIQAMLLVPLIAQTELIGLAAVIEGRRDRFFTADEVFKAETLGSQAAVALRQAQLYEEVRELERVKTEMIRMASHDLRNPLNTIMVYLDLLALDLEQQGATPDQQECITTIRHSAQAMRALLEDLLALERIESDRQSEWRPLDLGGLATEVVDAQRASALLKRQSLHVHCAPDAPPVYGSETHLRQAIANLVGNAVKYTPEGGHIVLRLTHGEGRLRLAVQDDGPGISPERQVRLFERFYRAREPGTEHIQGTGLGLSLVKAVVERHGGQVWFESAPGRGSTFGFWLPAAAG